MYSIASDEITVKILDPSKDKDRFGTRYCTGGYIFEVLDNRTGRNMLTGPTYPLDFHPFHGQGIPDTFNHIPLYLDDEELFLILGIGKVDMKSDRIIELCKWGVGESTNVRRMIFSTRHTEGKYDLSIIRTITVEGSKITTRTKLQNHVNVVVPIEWYPHPFFPPTIDGKFFTVSPESSFESPTGYFEFDNGNIRRVFGVDQELSFQPMKPGINPMKAHVHTGRGYSCIIETDYLSQSTPIWANDNTCSIEPYLNTTLFGNNSLEWSVSYDFQLN